MSNRQLQQARRRPRSPLTPGAQAALLVLTRPSGASSGTALGAAPSGPDLQLGEGAVVGLARSSDSRVSAQYSGTSAQDPSTEPAPVQRGDRVKKPRQARGEHGLTTSRGPMFEHQDPLEDEIDSDPSYGEPRAAGRRQPQDSALTLISHTAEQGSRRSTRETRGIAPDRLETDEIHPYGAQARAAELAATKKKGMPKIATAGKFRPGSKIPKSPTNKKNWEDPTFQAQALAMLHPVHALWRTDAGFLENLYLLQSKALTDTDGRFIFYCYAIAVTNTKIPRTLAIADIVGLVERVVDRVQVDRSLGETSNRRFPTPLQGEGGHPFIDEITISALSLPFLASLDAKTVFNYFQTHGLPIEIFDMSELPDDVLTIGKKAVPRGAWNNTVARLHGTLHRLFRAPIAPAALRTLMLSYISGPTYVTGMHPRDCLLFVNALLPGTFNSVQNAATFINNLVRYAHCYQAMCLDFLYRNFPGTLLGVLEFWVADHMCDNYDQPRTLTLARSEEQYIQQMERILDSVENSDVARDWMTLYRILCNSDNAYILLHIGAHNYKLMKMFPLYMEQCRVVKVQMYLCW
jgi:hypothetical protein